VTQRTFPRAGLLILGISSLAAAVLLVGRALAVDSAVERVVSAVLFGSFGVFWLAAYRSQP
jgi:hypothetical protein